MRIRLVAFLDLRSSQSLEQVVVKVGEERTMVGPFAVNQQLLSVDRGRLEALRFNVGMRSLARARDEDECGRLRENGHRMKGKGGGDDRPC